LAQNAPTTDGTRMASFLLELFSDDIVRERTERQDLIARVRTRALTLPPSDELRIMVERSDRVVPPRDDDENTNVDAPVRKPGSIGRRSEDRGDRDNDRRNQGDRRLGRSPLSASDGSGAAAAALAEAQPAETETDLIGVEVDGRYRVLELIGEGGMGKVYLAEHVEIGKRVALKVLHPSYSRMPDLVERFRREARAASKIGHPNIVDVTDSGTTAAGSVYFVMEYLEGVELGSVIEREGAIDVARALKITGQICRALAAAHREGIIHRDLKPENIFLITRDGAADVVKVLDFGIAKTTEAEAARERRLTSPGMAMGTPEYMAPEQAAGRPADARCDVYALGAILYEMVTGIPPYTGDNFMEILTKKATQDPPPPLTVRGDLPVQVGDLVMQAMARNPDHRPQTMEALEYELNKALSGRGVAVAQILGMTTDANVVATLNPGLSMRQYDDSMVVARPAVSSPAISLPRALTEGSLWSGPVMATGMNALQRVPTGQQQPLRAASVVEPSDSMREAALVQSAPTVASAPVPQKRSAAAVFGWIVLAAALFGGVGALLYASLGERGQRGGKSAVEGVPPAAAVDAFAGAGAPGSDLAVPVPSPVPDVQAPTPGSGSAGSTDDVVAPPSPPPPHGGAATLRDPHHKGPVHVAPAPPPPHHAPPAISASADDPRSLERQAVAMEQSGDWTAARAQWEKLAKVKGYGGKSLYKQAWAAFQSNEVNDAVRLAEQAAREHDSPYRQDALVLYGDALYRQGDPTHAKAIYVGIRKTANDSTRALMAKKIAACNKALNLPEGDTGE
ncbi:MAG TPA: protein kinase, partial [Kofleriaceae bacterium]